MRPSVRAKPTAKAGVLGRAAQDRPRRWEAKRDCRSGSATLSEGLGPAAPRWMGAIANAFPEARPNDAPVVGAGLCARSEQTPHAGGACARCGSGLVLAWRKAP